MSVRAPVRAFQLDIDAPSETAARDEVKKACKRLLANPVIHEYQIQVRKG